MLAEFRRLKYYSGLDILKAWYEESTWKGFGVTRTLSGRFVVRRLPV
jgi:hypothetical protein